MQRSAVVAFTGFALALALGGACGEVPDSPMQLEHLMHGDTPDEYAALARYYRKKALDATSIAEKHRVMAELYRVAPAPMENLQEHCERIAELNEELARQFESMAKGADDAAATLARAWTDRPPPRRTGMSFEGGGNEND